MTENGVEQGDGRSIVHQARAKAHAPQWCRAHFVGGAVEFPGREILPSDRVHLLSVMLGHGLNDAVAGAHVVKQKIAVGMKLLATHGVRNREGAADDFCAGWSGGQRLNVTLVAT